MARFLKIFSTCNTLNIYKNIYVGIPSTKEDREAIVAKHLENKILANGLTIEKVASYLVDLSGAKITGVINDTLLLSFREYDTENAKGIITEEFLDNFTFKDLQNNVKHKLSRYYVITIKRAEDSIFI